MQTINFQEIFTTQNIIIYFIAINLFGFFFAFQGNDNTKHRKSAD